ncbi:MAG: LytTR family transcriptional regulator DNA-binding domain-containing protein [Bacteroidota bacterium]
METTSPSQDRILLYGNKKLMSVLYKEILYLEADNSYLSVYLSRNREPVLLFQSLSQASELLQNNYFFQISRNHIVNLTKVKTIDVCHKKLYLDNKIELCISSDRLDDCIVAYSKIHDVILGKLPTRISNMLSNPQNLPFNP